ncbi:MAG TPA: substrate-binding domain-containing protein, partial [Spirochaetales bacterium]|nr:substrate-binding domain-containing protein [Spirochaetales bacterium]
RGRLEDAARRALVDALLAIGVGPDHSVISLFRKRHIPLVTIDGESVPAMANVGIDDEAAAFTLMRHVLELGHRKLAVIELETEIYHEPPARSSMARDRRMAGFERALAMEGLNLDSPGISIHASECSLEGGRACAERVLGPGRPDVTAVVAMSDIVALGFYDGCSARGLSIPQDMSIVAFDGIEFGSLVKPGLTTLQQPGYTKGYEAATLLLDMLGGGRMRHITMDAKLLVRGSSARVPDHGR